MFLVAAVPSSREKKKRIKKASNRKARSKEEDTAVQEAAGKDGCLVIALS